MGSGSVGGARRMAAEVLGDLEGWAVKVLGELEGWAVKARRRSRSDGVRIGSLLVGELGGGAGVIEFGGGAGVLESGWGFECAC